MRGVCFVISKKLLRPIKRAVSTCLSLRLREPE